MPATLEDGSQSRARLARAVDALPTPPPGDTSILAGDEIFIVALCAQRRGDLYVRKLTYFTLHVKLHPSTPGLFYPRVEIIYRDYQPPRVLCT